ncbi:putative HTH-type transcriptional regulator YazB [Lentibacillus sp. JNUCC-1]|uniref:helix-turn-helix domain-containing protein n=1 Tax=Lentibacillus sp. JNUCC-1 TaxID=2654513 RepID=UPI0012E8FA40|nr:helix-turn-helix transcriptional regulator [Lentibacillus sp. JNUCC-1]MUV38050.1 putative HTH-type transcriptional regulator YazB [Lentibacillus sp. JNUCC-1]
MEKEQLGRRIKAFRKLKGYTQVEFAESLHISVAILGPVERGKTSPDDQLLERIIETLNISKAELLLEDKEER